MLKSPQLTGLGTILINCILFPILNIWAFAKINGHLMNNFVNGFEYKQQ